MEQLKHLAFEILPEIDNLDKFNLYHYTSAEGLIGILRDKQLWFTQIYYMNDLEENINGWRFLGKNIDSILEKHQTNNLKINKYLNELRNAINVQATKIDEGLGYNAYDSLSIKDNRIFIFSTSSKSDDLSQWRSYTQPANGYCIRFNFTKVLEQKQKVFIINRNHDEHLPGAKCDLFIRKCIYDDEEKRLFVDKLINRMINYLSSHDEKDIDHVFLQKLVFQFLINFSRMTIFFKNNAFVEEDEYRIAIILMDDHETYFQKRGGAFPSANKRNVIKFRPGKSSLIPYIELDLPLELIKGVTIGPTPLPLHSIEALGLMLQNYFKSTTEAELIKTSKIPYRNW